MDGQIGDVIFSGSYPGVVEIDQPDTMLGREHILVVQVAVDPAPR